MPQRKTKPQKKSTTKAKGSYAAGSTRVVQAPAAQTRQVTTKQPRMVGSRSGFRVMHREAVGSITGTTDFTVTQYPINPGVDLLFPWLAAVASNWEKYTFHSLVVRYVPRCSTSSVGSIIIAPDFDAEDAAPTSELVMLSYQDAVETPPWAEVVMRMTQKQLHGDMPRRFVRGSSEQAELRTSDCGVLNVATAGSTGLQGRLFVEYDVEFFQPGSVPSGVSPVSPLRNMVFITDVVSSLDDYLAQGTFLVNQIGATANLTGFSFNNLRPTDRYLFTMRIYMAAGGGGDLAVTGSNLVLTNLATHYSGSSTELANINNGDVGILVLQLVPSANTGSLYWQLGDGSSIQVPDSVQCEIYSVPSYMFP